MACNSGAHATAARRMVDNYVPLPGGGQRGGAGAVREARQGRQVPGHGQICGQEGIASIREVFDDIAGQAEKMHKAGVPAEEAQHRYVVPEKFKNFTVFAWGFTIGPAIAKLYAEWQGK